MRVEPIAAAAFQERRPRQRMTDDIEATIARETTPPATDEVIDAVRADIAAWPSTDPSIYLRSAIMRGIARQAPHRFEAWA